MQIWGEHGWLRLAAVEEQPLEWYSTKDAKDAEGRALRVPRRASAATCRSCGPRCGASAGLEEAPITGEEGLHVLEDDLRLLRGGQDGTDADRIGRR